MASFVEQLHTSIFNFVVGDDETEVHVHGGVIAALSPPLERLINGPMVEGQTRKVIFPQLQLEDFERICEFAYRGDYSVPKPTTFDEDAVNPRMASVVNACPIVTVYDDLEPSDYESDRYSERESNVGAKKGNLPEHFRRARYPLVGWTRKQFARVADIEPNSHWTQNYAPVFLGHARLYVFAHMYMIAELRNLVLHKLHRTLKRFTLYCSGCSSIVELARYVYDDDLLPGRQNGQIDKLRELVVEFVALNVEHFSEEEVHRDLLNQDGEYAADLLTTTLKWRL